MEPKIMSAAGNGFALLDGFQEEWPAEPSATARELCRAGSGLQGSILLGPPRNDGDGRMVLYNADGGRAEISANGLRCVAKFLFDRGYARSEDLVIETDVGHRRVHLMRKGDAVEAVRVDLGVPDIVEARFLLEVDDEVIEATWVNTGNPHCVIFVEDEQAAPVERLGPRIECHPRFPAGVNVNFAAPRGRVLGLRTWERGVGESPSCGSGSCAAAVAGIRMGLVVSPVWVETRGGTLEVEWDRFGSVLVTGPVQDGLPATSGEPESPESPGESPSPEPPQAE